MYGFCKWPCSAESSTSMEIPRQQYGSSSAQAVVQGNMLYASRLTWNGKKGVERECQQAIKRMGWASLGAIRSTPHSIVAAETGFTPARALITTDGTGSRRGSRLDLEKAMDLKRS